MNKRFITTIIVICLMLIPFTITGVYASWMYFTDPAPIDEDINSKLGNFVYGDIYITKVEKISTSSGVVNATLEKTEATTVAGNIDLGSSENATATFSITFYNGSDTIYYYNEAETIQSDNSDIVYQVDGIAQKDAVAPKTYKTITVTYSYEGAETQTLKIPVTRGAVSQTHALDFSNSDVIGDMQVGANNVFIVTNN